MTDSPMGPETPPGYVKPGTGNGTSTPPPNAPNDSPMKFSPAVEQTVDQMKDFVEKMNNFGP